MNKSMTLDEFLEQGYAFGGGEELAGVADSPQTIINADGTFVENWTDRFDETDREHLSRYKSVDELGKSHMNLTRKYKKDPDTMVEIPRDDSSDEVKAAWAKAHNVPELSDGYEYALSDELAVKLGPLDDKRMTAMREFARKKNWSPTDFKDVLDFYHNNMADDINAGDISFNEQQVADAETNKVALKKEWLGDYDNKVLRANAVLRKYGGEDAVASFNAQNSPLMAKFLDNIAGAMSEDTIISGGPPSDITKGNVKVRIAENRAQMDTIMKENPVNYRNDVKFRDLDNRNIELYKQMPA